MVITSARYPYSNFNNDSFLGDDEEVVQMDLPNANQPRDPQYSMRSSCSSTATPVIGNIAPLSNRSYLQKEESNENMMLDDMVDMLGNTALENEPRRNYSKDASTRMLDVLNLDFDNVPHRNYSKDSSIRMLDVLNVDFDDSMSIDSFDCNSTQGPETPVQDPLNSYPNKPFSPPERCLSYQDSFKRMISGALGGSDVKDQKISTPVKDPMISPYQPNQPNPIEPVRSSSLQDSFRHLVSRVPSVSGGFYNIGRSISSMFGGADAKDQEQYPVPTNTNTPTVDMAIENRRDVFKSLKRPANDDVNTSFSFASFKKVLPPIFRRQPTKTYITGEPTELDVLFGRGGETNKHPGNVKYRDLIEERKEVYKSLGAKDAKSNYSVMFRDHVYSYGGRFLKKEQQTGRWYIVEPEKAREKCRQALSEAAKKKKKQPK